MTPFKLVSEDKALTFKSLQLGDYIICLDRVEKVVALSSVNQAQIMVTWSDPAHSQPGLYLACNHVYGVRLTSWWLCHLEVDQQLYGLIPPGIKYVHQLQQWLRVYQYARADD